MQVTTEHIYIHVYYIEMYLPHEIVLWYCIYGGYVTFTAKCRLTMTLFTFLFAEKKKLKKKKEIDNNRASSHMWRFHSSSTPTVSLPKQGKRKKRKSLYIRKVQPLSKLHVYYKMRESLVNPQWTNQFQERASLWMNFLPFDSRYYFSLFRSPGNRMATNIARKG